MLKHRVVQAVAGTVALLVGVLLGPTPLAGASANAGVASSTVKIGLPYIDFSSLRALGITLNQGNVPDDFDALIANLNSHGGINGRKVVATAAGVNPTSSAAAMAVCTQLTEDVQIFVAMDPYMPACYLQQHGTPTINAALAGTPTAGSAANFTLSPPLSAYDPLQLSVFSKMGLFKGKKVGVFGAAADQDEIAVVRSTLRALHVDVVQSAVDSAPSGDQLATNQQVAAASERFESSGVNEVVAVGTGSSIWPGGLYDNQSTYNPSWIATSYAALSGYIGGSTGNTPTYLKTMVTSNPGPSSVQQWKDPAIQQCVRIIEKAYPANAIATPTLTANSSDHSYIGAIDSCQATAMFATITRAAGKNLTVASFTRAGYALRNVTFPGSGGPVSFGPGRAYAIGPVYVGRYSVAAKQIVLASKSATS